MLFVLYVMNVNGTAIGRKKRFYWFFILPYLVAEAVVLTNPVTNLAFTLDAAGVYHRGVLMPFLYCLAAIYMVTGVYFFIRYQRAIPRAESVAIVSVVLLSLIGVVIQAIRPDCAVELFGEALTIQGFMVMLEDRTGVTDQTTQVFNRRAFSDANRRLLETEQSYRIILIKLLNLDRLSRLFTSRDADKLVVALVRWLETVTDRDHIFRYRSEDFALILRGRQAAEADAMAQHILQRFREPWKTDEADVPRTARPVRRPSAETGNVYSEVELPADEPLKVRRTPFGRFLPSAVLALAAAGILLIVWFFVELFSAQHTVDVIPLFSGVACLFSAYVADVCRKTLSDVEEIKKRFR